MTSHETTPFSPRVKVLLFILGIILAVLLFFLVRESILLHRGNVAAQKELSLSAFVQKHGPLNVDEIGVIRPWMTFDYVNRLFGLPTGYFKTTLNITDPAYPTMPISQYTDDVDQSNATVITMIQNAIKKYFTANPPASL